MKKVIFIFFFFVSFNLLAQNFITRFPIQDSTKEVSNSIILAGPENSIQMFFQEGDSLFSSQSVDDGLTWMEKRFVFKIGGGRQSSKSLDGLSLTNGNIVLVHRDSSNQVIPTYHSKVVVSLSDDYGISWRQIYSYSEHLNRNIQLSQINDSTYWIIQENTGDYWESINYAETWVKKSFSHNAGRIGGAAAVSINDSLILFVSSSVNSISGRISKDRGQNWGDPFIISYSTDRVTYPKVIKKDNELVLAYNSLNQIREVNSKDGISWTWSVKVTNYLGNNFNVSLTSLNDIGWISFASDRFNDTQIYYSKFGFIEDDITPPYIEEVLGPDEYLKNKMNFNAIIRERSLRNLNVSLKYKLNNSEVQTKEMNYLYEDDDISYKYYYRTEVSSLNEGDTLIYRILASNNEGFTTRSKNDTIVLKAGSLVSKYLFDVNRFSMPIDNYGVLGDVLTTHSDGNIKDGGRYTDKVVLFSGGIGLSGYNDEGVLWSNGTISASRVQDYIPGVINKLENIVDTSIYVLDKTDPPFGYSWNLWKDAVELGANFYDGDGNEKYEPIDKNKNGAWDTNEDRPDILGDVTTWSVYNDGRPSELRRFENVNPQGIEIRQTMWGYDKIGALNNTLFIRYSLLNTGTVSDYHDSIYFSIWIDPDIGSRSPAYRDDLAGCDTNLNAGFTFNDGPDVDFGNKPPSLFTKYLQGPVAESGNSDSIAFNKRGFLGEDSIKGYINLPLSSFMWYGGGISGLDDPDDEFQTRNYFLGRDQAGNIIDPCTFVFGEVLNYDCTLVDPKFAYSGDPVNRIGWLSTNPDDLRVLSNTGPFKLEKGKPVDIIVAYIVGDGESALNSVTVGKEYAKQIQQFYENNFTHYVVSDIEADNTLIPTELSLSQNYPNPFNPSTTIEYSIPKDVKRETENVKGPFIPSGVEGGKVKLTVYDVLGREVKTLINKEQSAGNYKISFNASDYSSGVYFYRLKYDSNIITKKMVILK